MYPDEQPAAFGAGLPSHTDDLATQLGRLHWLRERTMSQVGRHGPDGLELAAYRCVFMLLQHGPMRTGTLAETMLADPSTVSRHVGQLVRRGHLERTPDPDDRRASLIAVTDSGRAAAARMRRDRNLRLAKVVGGWSDDERGELARLLAKLLDGYETRREEIRAQAGGATGEAADRPGDADRPGEAASSPDREDTGR